MLLDRVRSAAAEHSDALVEVLASDGLVVLAKPGSGQLKLHLGPGGSLVALGTIFTRIAGDTVELALDRCAAAPHNAIRLLFETVWGSYVVFSRGQSRSSVLVARDPSGGLPVWIIDGGGVAVICDSFPEWLRRAVDRVLPIEKRVLANALATPLVTTHRSLLKNVALVPAGVGITWEGRLGGSETMWKPVAPTDGADGAGRIRDAVLSTVSSLARDHDRLLIELSGGLDSAIVLGALASSRERGEIMCVNLATVHRGGDERLTARAAADRWSVELVEFEANEKELDYRPQLGAPQPLQPILYGLDAVLESAVSGVADAFEAGATLTGQGGDAVFFQLPTDKVAIDYARRHGLRALFSQVALDAARRTRKSLWRVQWRILRDRLVGTRPERMPMTTAFLGPTALDYVDAELCEHPWLRETSHLPPGKQLQLLAITNCQLFNGPTPRRQHAPLIHPLMAQPVLEACLATPLYQLSWGTADRALARAAFADLIPASIARRRGKGETSIYYRRAIVENLPFLKQHLLDGCLVANGFLDSDALSAIMTEDALLWHEDAHMLTVLSSFESWARHWGL